MELEGKRGQVERPVSWNLMHRRHKTGLVVWRRWQRGSSCPRQKFAMSPMEYETFVVGTVEEEELKPIPRDVEGPADDPSLHNPLQRMERLGTGWMGVIFEMEGVVLAYESKEIVEEAWKRVAHEEGKQTPLKWQLARAVGMKDDQVVQEVFCWTRRPEEVRRLVVVKQEIVKKLLDGVVPVEMPAAEKLLSNLKSNNTPRALVTTVPEDRVHRLLSMTQFGEDFDAVVTGDDVCRGRPDPEGYLYAAQRLHRPPFRCVVIGNSNATIEAAHEAGMKCIVAAGSTPLYELSSADMAIKSLEELSFVNLKRLFSGEEGIMFEEEEEMEENEFPQY